MRSIRATLRAALAEAWSNRRGFWWQVVAMAVNDLVWILFWVFFFRRVGTVRGWDVDSIMLLLAAVTVSVGIALGFLNNCNRIGRLVANGELDAVLALPTPPLAHLLVRRVGTTHFGDVAFGVILFLVACHPTPARTAAFLFSILTATTITVGFFVATGSLAFFLGRGEAGQLGGHAMLIFGAYPADVFVGGTKLLLYTLVPAAFIGSVPVRLIEEFDLRLAAGAAGAAVAFAAGGWFLFTRGHRRYTSGAVWTRP